MRVKLIAGKFGGRFIQAPPGSTTHPMGERVRSAMFNSLGEIVRGARVLDAFAGSGAIGLEALSRGAESVFLWSETALPSESLPKILAPWVPAKTLL